jgi:hypothetical protein
MHKSATKCNETIGKWCKNKHGASKIIDTLETYHLPLTLDGRGGGDSVQQEQMWEGHHGRSTKGREPTSVGGGGRLRW